MATYNRAELLERSIESLLAQYYKKWELIIIDDGSEDSSFDTVNSYIKKYQNIRYIKHSNRKLALTRNVGILNSIGEYITFLDSDDKFKKDHLSLRIEYMQSQPDIDLIYGGIEIIGNPYVKDKNDLSKMIHLSDCIIGATLFGKRRVFYELEGFQNLLYSEDSDFFERAKNKFNTNRIDYPSYIYFRDTLNSICSTI